ncbi:MAG: LPS export ABC transporter periplasmic protein LptC [Deltaproteobacteria bacterium]|jgi:LPS export ABC transporter protein LptC|nr:LPS export ABC transporter periplasmic protein LptC [Deltaproteobacteria bacterium]
MSRLRFLILCLLGGFVVVLGLLLWNAKNLSGVRLGALKNMLPTNVDMRLSTLDLSEIGEGGRSINLAADTANYFKEQNYFILTGIRADISSADEIYTVTAENGRYEPDLALVTLTGAVRTADSRGRILTSQRLSLDMRKGRFVSEEAFCLENPVLSLSGGRFDYDTNKGVLEVEGQVFLLLGAAGDG